MKRAAIHTLGCRLNQAESALLRDRLTEAGYTIVPFGGPADLGIIHTCTVTREADAKSRQMIRQFIRANPDARTVVIGCYTETGSEKVAAMEGVDLILGNHDKLDLLAHLEALDRQGDRLIRRRMTRESFAIDYPKIDTPITERVNLKIQDGCDFMCSFCIIPFARGRSRSRILENLLDEAAHLVRRGAKELILSGINVGDYAYEGKDLTAVVDGLHQIPGLARIRIGSIEFTTIPEGLLDRMADPAHALVPYLHIPLQSGANPILRQMKRHYTREEFLLFLEEARRRVPGIGLGTDILVGFPGETDQDFQDSFDLYAAGPLQYAHIFKYSERPGSAASRRGDRIDPKIVAARSAQLHALDETRRRAVMESRIGDETAVLFETLEKGYWTGYTENYLRVAVRSEIPLNNRIGRVRLEKSADDWAIGTLLTIESPANCHEEPRHNGDLGSNG